MQEQKTKNINIPFPEYPRPQLIRGKWYNLNGLWDFTVTETKDFPENFNEKILVPFSPESIQSGICRSKGNQDYLWYRRILPEINRPSGARVILHIGASDRESCVWINGALAAENFCGYLPFSADITDFLTGKNDLITVRVFDDTDTSYHTRGKQKTSSGGIWYTAQSGIWQTVWLETVPESYVESLTVTPDFDAGTVSVSADISGPKHSCFAVFNGEEFPLPANIFVPDFEPWTPENPKLYRFEVICGEDRVESYFAMRKISVEKDGKGNTRIFLNGKPCFMNGVLDQGYWEQGLYTPPDDEAMIQDITAMKSMGFNVLRKHIKIEPLRWYYHCDRLGMMVWQDMPSGGGKYNPAIISLPLITGISINDGLYSLFSRADKSGREEFRQELIGMIKHLYNCPCIVMWVIFNEGWGQFDASDMTETIRKLDASRLIDHASGWHDQLAGDVRSEHVYFKKYKYRPDKAGRAVVLSEFGGYIRRIEGHCFSKKTFGYKNCKNEVSFEKAFRRLYTEEILPAAASGLSAAIYTQLSDVENELNGLITYDREVIKLSPPIVKNIISIKEEE